MAQTVSASDQGASAEDIFKTNRQRVYAMNISSSGGDAVLSGLTSQATGGDYVAGDIVNFSLYYNSTNDFASANLISTSGTSTGKGEAIAFSGFSQTIPQNGSSYLYIAANVSSSAGTGNTFSFNFFALSNFTFSTGTGGGFSCGPSGTKTIQPVPVPAITGFSPDRGTTGASVTINGTNFTGTTSVMFGGVEAESFTIVSDTELIAVVADGASGIISITTSAGTAESDKAFVFESSGIVVYNAVSPNGDGKNDTMIIQSIESYRNKVSIVNRWGDVVFEVTNYNNTTRVFAGKSKDGKDLPSGIYFYKIEFENGQKSLEGFLSLKR